MLLGFGYLYKIVRFCFFFFFQKVENNRLKKYFNTVFLYLLKTGSVGAVEQQINLV